jgi:transposase
VRETIVEQIATLDAGLQRIAKGGATIRRLMIVPGIGLITALAFALAIGNPFRFRKASASAISRRTLRPVRSVEQQPRRRH